MFKSVPVLCYHKVSYAGGITPERFTEHLEYLQNNGFETISAELLYNFMSNNVKLPKKPVVITFDDCSLDNWVYAIPLLNKYNFSGIFFAITNFIGDGEKRAQFPNKNLPEILDAKTSFINVLKNSDKTQFMNKNEIYSAVHDFGHEVYSHSVNHQMCFKSMKLIGNYPEKFHWGIYGIYNEVKQGTKYFDKGSAYAYDGFWPIEENGKVIFKKRNTDERYHFCLKEFKESKEYLENILNKPIDFFCWPWGHFDKVSMQALKDSGYKGSFTLERFPNSYGTNPFYINRIGVNDKDNIKWLSQKLNIYSNKITATIFFKKFKKQKELNKILFITDSNKYSSGGIRQLSYNIESLYNCGLDIYLISKKNAEINNIVSGFCKNIYHADFKYKILAALGLLNVLKKEHIDIIHTYHNGGHKLGFWLTLLNLKKNKLFINRGVLSKPNNLFYYINPIIDSFTCNSLACVNVLKSRFIKSSKINLIYNHIRTKNISNKIKKDALYLCYIGNENPIKGFDIFNDIFTELRKTIEIKAYAVGIDANKVKINVHNDIELVGETKDVYQYLLKSDISVLTSRSESFPNVILEAMNAGLPIVASKVGAVPEIIINDKMGYICNSKEEFIEKIVHLSKNKELRDKMGTLNSEILSKNFDIHTKAEKLLRVYCGENYIDKISEL